jgi:hemolysin activation/secretion protein
VQPPASAQRGITPFVVTDVRVEGSSAPPALIDAVTRPFIGQTLDDAGLARLTNAVAKIYETSDVALYTIVAPKQDFAGGHVRLVALEGYIANVAVHAIPPGQDMSLVKAYGERLTRERPLRKPTLERYVSLIRDIPGATVDMDLLATGKPEAVRLGMELKQKRFDGGFSLNTRGTARLGRTQVAFDGYWNGMLTQGDQAHLAVAAPTDFQRFRYYGLSYQRPLGSTGLTGTASAGYLKTRPKDVPITGKATMGALQLRYPVIRGYKQNLYVSGGIDMLNSQNALFGQTLSDERTRALRAAVGWSRTGERTSTGVQAAVGLGIDGLGARVSHPGLSKADFRKLGVTLAQDRVLTKTVVARLRLTGQATGDRLPASEQFALGGDDYGRAFDASTLVGDYGYGASGELAWIPRNLPKPVAGTELYGFVDGGKVWSKGRLGLPTTNASLSSAGGGVRLAVKSKAVIDVEGARAIDSPPGLDRSWRLIFSLRTVLD